MPVVAKPVAEFPPMMPWPTFSGGVIDYFKESGHVPPFLVQESLPSVTPELRSRVLTGLRALKLLDGAGRTAPFFRTLVEARGTGQWQVQLRVLMSNAYPYLTYLNLSQASSTDLRAAFVGHLKKDTDNLGKAEVFYLNLAQAAGVRLSDTLQRRVTASMAMAAAKAAKKQPDNSTTSAEDEPDLAEAAPAKDANALTPNMTHRLDVMGWIIDAMKIFQDQGLSPKEVEAFVVLLELAKRKTAEMPEKFGPRGVDPRGPNGGT